MAILTLDFDCNACHYFGVGENAKSTILNDVQITPPNRHPKSLFHLAQTLNLGSKLNWKN
jgi:hypothetical protein